MTDELKKEYTLRISQGSATQIIVILYEMAIGYATNTRDLLAEGKHDEARIEGANAAKVIGHLIGSLDFTYELSMNLYRIYEYISKEISMAVIKNDSDKLNSPIKMLDSLRESFEKLSKEDTSGPMMSNSQAVYTGLTYGKGSLNDSTMVENSNRGFTV